MVRRSKAGAALVLVALMTAALAAGTPQQARADAALQVEPRECNVGNTLPLNVTFLLICEAEVTNVGDQVAPQVRITTDLLPFPFPWWVMETRVNGRRMPIPSSPAEGLLLGDLDPGQSATGAVLVIVNPQGIQSQVVTVRAFDAAGHTAEATRQGGTSPSVARPPTDLEVMAEPVSTSSTGGVGRVTFRIDARNIGTSDISGLHVVDQFAVNFLLDSADPPPSSVAHASGGFEADVVRWDLGGSQGLLAPGEGRTILVTARTAAVEAPVQLNFPSNGVVAWSGASEQIPDTGSAAALSGGFSIAAPVPTVSGPRGPSGVTGAPATGTGGYASGAANHSTWPTVLAAGGMVLLACAGARRLVGRRSRQVLN